MKALKHIGIFLAAALLACSCGLSKVKEIAVTNVGIAYFVTGPLELQAKTEETYELPCTVVLDEGVSILEVLLIAAKGSLEGLKADVDIQGALKKNGVLRAPISFRDLDISQFKK